MALNESDRRSYFERGYLVFQPDWPAGLIDGIRADVDPKYPDRAEDGSFPKPTRLQDAWKFSRNVHALATHSELLNAIEFLYGRRPIPFQTLNFPVGTEQAIHSDTVHFNSLPAGWMCGAWCALEDIEPDCGPLAYYPGTHTWPEAALFDPPESDKPFLKKLWHKTMVKLGIREHQRDYDRYIGEVKTALDREGLQPSFATLKKGQVLIWSANILHGGSARTNPLRTRHSQVTHFFFPGCRYFRPVNSSSTRIRWFSPEAIPS